MTIICDFCSGTPVRWAYPARNFVSPTTPVTPDFHSWGNWAACEACHALIALGDRESLARRSARTFIEKNPTLEHLGEVALTAELRTLHDRFWSSREGPPSPVA